MPLQDEGEFSKITVWAEWTIFIFADNSSVVVQELPTLTLIVQIVTFSFMS